MDYLKLLKEDISFNAQNPRYANDEPQDYKYGDRYDGYWTKMTENNSRLFIFDNGHVFEIMPDSTLFYDDVGIDYFIDKDIEVTLNEFIVEHKVGGKVSRYGDEIESQPFIRVIVSREERVVAIPNIYLSPEMRHQGLGKKAISIIYDICKRLNYKLYLVQMVESFYLRMLNRGAEVVVPYDTLEITDNTNLSE
jgi:GNAT superfamily N-acetyltransferase